MLISNYLILSYYLIIKYVLFSLIYTYYIVRVKLSDNFITLLILKI